ncbi:MAG: hypothetical protein ACOY3Y_04575 [Acidobacteriota bacterium]
MLVLLALLASAAPQAMVPYPVKVVDFELRAADKMECECIQVRGGSVNRALMTAEEAAQLDDILGRVKNTWEAADQRQRVTMTVGYLRLASVGRTTHYSETVFSCRDGLRVRATKVVTGGGETATLLEDLDTGEYLLHLHTTRGSPASLIRLLFELPRGSAKGPAPGSEPEIERRVEELTRRFSKDLELKFSSWDVNGQIHLPAKEARTPEVYAELEALWPNLSAKAGQHIKTVWGILEAFDNGAIGCDGEAGVLVAAGPALDPDYLFALRPPALSCRVDPTRSMRAPSFQLPDVMGIKDLAGSKEWSPLPSDVSFAEAVRWLRRRR